MKLLTKAQRERLVRNGESRGEDHRPVVKLFVPWAAATWLLTELDPEDTDRAFGLCDLGHGFPELGYVNLREVEGLVGPGGLRVERDRYFEGQFPISVYCADAQRDGYIQA